MLAESDFKPYSRAMCLRVAWESVCALCLLLWCICRSSVDWVLFGLTSYPPMLGTDACSLLRMRSDLLC
jgi:hypothetical protein